jgi:hypothetical protein
MYSLWICAGEKVNRIAAWYTPIKIILDAVCHKINLCVRIATKEKIAIGVKQVKSEK